MHRHNLAEPFFHQLRIFTNRFGNRTEDHASFFQLRTEGGGDGYAIENRIHRNPTTRHPAILAAFHAREQFLLGNRDTQLFIDAQDFGIDLVQTAQLGLRLGRSVIIGILIIDRINVELGPIGHLHRQPMAIGLQPPFEHPFGLILLGGDETNGVFAQPLGRELRVDVARPAMLIIGNAGGSFAGSAILDVDVVGHRVTRLVRVTSAKAPRTVWFTTAQCGLMLQSGSIVQ